VAELSAFLSSNLGRRVLSSLILAPVILFAVYRGGWFYALIVGVIIVLAALEWLRLTSRLGPMFQALAIPLIGSTGFALMYLRATSAGMAPVYYLLAVVWGTDIGAYIAGRAIGGPKLAPVISPNKTWAGLVGGMVLAAVLGYSVAAKSGSADKVFLLILALILAVISQLGDLFESVIKRRADVKESGALIPGHGGILDRIDGLIFASIAFALILCAVDPRRLW